MNQRNISNWDNSTFTSLDKPDVSNRDNPRISIWNSSKIPNWDSQHVQATNEQTNKQTQAVRILYKFRKLSWPVRPSREGNLHGSGIHMSHARTVSPKPSFRTPWRQGDALVARKMLDGQRQIVDIPAHARTAYNGLLQQQKIKTSSLKEDLC